MAAQTYGTALLAGISVTVTSAKISNFNVDQSCANVLEAENESGIVCTRRYDDITNEGSITLRYISGYVLPTAGTTLVYDSGVTGTATTTWEITKVGKASVARGFRTVELSIKNSEGITSY